MKRISKCEEVQLNWPERTIKKKKKKKAEGIKQQFVHTVRNNQHKKNLRRYGILDTSDKMKIMYKNPITHVCHLTTLKSTDIPTRIIHAAEVQPIYSCKDRDSLRLGKSAFTSIPPLSHSYFPALTNYTISLPVQAKLYAK